MAQLDQHAGVLGAVGRQFYPRPCTVGADLVSQRLRLRLRLWLRCDPYPGTPHAMGGGSENEKNKKRCQGAESLHEQSSTTRANTQWRFSLPSAPDPRQAPPRKCICSPGGEDLHPQDPSPLVLLHTGRQHAAAQHPRLEGGLGGLGLGGPAGGLTGSVCLWPLVQLGLGREDSGGVCKLPVAWGRGPFYGTVTVTAQW